MIKPIDNYFLVLGIKNPKFNISKKLVTEKYIKLQRAIHMDLHNLLHQAALINKAYVVLSDPILRAEHIFHLARLNTQIHAVSPRLFEMMNDPKKHSKIAYKEMQQAFYANDLSTAYEAWCIYKYLINPLQK